MLLIAGKQSSGFSVFFSFRGELKDLKAENVIELSVTEQAAIDQYHDALLKNGLKIMIRP